MLITPILVEREGLDANELILPTLLLTTSKVKQGFCQRLEPWGLLSPHSPVPQWNDDDDGSDNDDDDDEEEEEEEDDDDDDGPVSDCGGDGNCNGGGDCDDGSVLTVALQCGNLVIGITKRSRGMTLGLNMVTMKENKADSS